MKKVLGFIGLIAMAVVGWFGYRYYTDTYVGVEAYAVVPQEVPTKQEAKDSSGKVVTESDGTPLYSYQYDDLTFVTRDGKTQKNSYYMEGTNPTPFEPGSYIKAKVSKTRVVEGPYAVSESDVPQSVKDHLK